jgi:hypothetical protein
MIMTQGLKFQQVLAPISINGTAATTLSIDTKGYDHLDVVVQFGVVGAAAFDAFALQSSNTDASYAAVTGLTASGSTGANRLPQATDDAKMAHFGVNLMGHKRFFSLVADPGAVDCLVSAVAVLSRGEETPNSMADRGFDIEFLLPA